MLESLLDILEKNEGFKPEDREYVKFGIYMGLMYLLNVASALVVGFVFGMVLEVIVFLIIYMPLRSYAGGYHADSPWSCYFLSILLIVVAMGSIYFLDLSVAQYYLLAAASFSIVVLSPVEHENKPLDYEEKVVNRQKALLRLALALIIWNIALLISEHYAIVIATGVVAVSLLQLFGYIRNKRI